MGDEFTERRQRAQGDAKTRALAADMHQGDAPKRKSADDLAELAGQGDAPKRQSPKKMRSLMGQ